MVRRLNTTDPGFAADFEALLFAKREIEEDVAQAVRGLIADVRERGDAALVELTNKFDRAGVTAKTLKISSAEIDAALASGKEPLACELDDVVAARKLTPSTQTAVEELFNARAALVYAGGRGNEAVRATDRDRVQETLAEYERSEPV